MSMQVKSFVRRVLVLSVAAVLGLASLVSDLWAEATLPGFVDQVDVDGHLELIGDKVGSALVIGLGLAVGLLVVFWAYRKAKALAGR